MPAFVDLADWPEEKRIQMIAHQVQRHGHTVGFIVEDDAKADRYIKRLKEIYPAIEIMFRGPGPIENSVIVKVGPPLN